MQESKEPEFHHIITVEDIGNLKKKINIMYDKDGVEMAVQEAATGVAKNAHVKGFRVGKAPMALIKKVCKDQIDLAAKSILTQRGYFHACNENKLVVLKEPEFNNPKFNVDGTFTCDVDVEVRPAIEPVGYIGLQLDKPNADKEPYIQGVLDRVKQEHVKDVNIEVVENKTMVVVDFKVKVGDEVLNSGEEQPFLISEGQDAPFGENLLGMKVGDTKVEKFTLPKGYGKHGGEESDVEITLRSAIKKIEPTEEELLAALQIESSEELMKLINSQGEQEHNQQVNKVLQEQAVNKLLEMHEFDVPEDWCKDEERFILSQFGLSAAPDEETTKSVKEMAERNVKRTFMLDAIYEAEPSIKVTEEDVKNLMDSEAAANGVSSLMVKKEWEEKNIISNVIAHIKHSKVIKLILTSAQIGSTQNEVAATDVPENPMDSVEI